VHKEIFKDIDNNSKSIFKRIIIMLLSSISFPTPFIKSPFSKRCKSGSLKVNQKHFPKGGPVYA